eukprot:UN4768
MILCGCNSGLVIQSLNRAFPGCQGAATTTRPAQTHYERAHHAASTRLEKSAVDLSLDQHHQMLS